TPPSRASPLSSASLSPFVGVWVAVQRLRGRQLDPEGRALVLCAREADLPAVRLDDLAREGEPEAAAGDAALGRVAAEERREAPGLQLVGDAHALVSDLDPHDPLAPRAVDLDGAAGGRVLDRVRVQVRDARRESVLVAYDGQPVVSEVELQAV